MLGWALKRFSCQKSFQSERLGQLECPGCTDSDSGTTSRGSHPEEMPPNQGWAAPRAKQSQPGIWAGYGSARWHSLKLTHSHFLTSTGAQERRGHLLPQESLAPATQRWLKVSLRNTCWPLEQLGKVSLPLFLLCWIAHSTHTFPFLASPLHSKSNDVSPKKRGLNQNFRASTAFQEELGHSPEQTDCHYRKAWIVFQLQVEFSYDRPEAESLFHCTKYIELAISL